MDKGFTKTLHLGDELFDEARNNYNRALQKLLDRMMKSKASKGTITLKMDIEMDTDCIDDFRDGEARKRDVFLPKFSHSVSTTITEKPFDEKGNIDPEMEMYFDEDACAYQLKPVANTTQKTLFDDDFEESMNEPELKVAEEEPWEPEEKDEEEAQKENIFNFLKGCIGSPATVEAAQGRYHLVCERDDDVVIILSPDFPDNHPLHMESDVLEEYKETAIECDGYETDGKIVSIAIECIDTGAVLFEMENPERLA